MNDKPDFLKIGQLVMIDGWCGRIEDVAVTEAGGIMVLVNSPKAIWRNQRPEWLPYIDGRITPVDFAAAEPLFLTYVERVKMMAAALVEMQREWGGASVLEGMGQF
jgi:hypothetical protein